MSECICSSCKHLKSVVSNEDVEKNGVVEEYECEYGFPDEKCSECEEDGCELTCEHYERDQEEALVIVHCAKCGKELKVTPGNEEDGEVYCVTCFLNK